MDDYENARPFACERDHRLVYQLVIESVFGEIGAEEDVNDRSFALFLYRRSCEVVEERRKQTE